MADRLIHLPIEEARAAKWRRGRESYGPLSIGHPLEELDEELLDAHELRGRVRTAGLSDDRDTRRPSRTLRTNPRNLSRGRG
jgi:hypothetical protein